MLTGDSVETTRICPECRKSFGEEVNYCPHDGMPLIDRSMTFSSISDSGEKPPPSGDPDREDEGVPIEPGMMIGQYKVEQVIAQGGMGVIYAGIHPVIRKRVAIKVLTRRYAQNPKAISRFVLEARSVNEIGHHNIVDIFSIGELDDERNYLIMELLDGLSLHEILLRQRRLQPGEVLPIYDQMCNALQAAHDKGFVHRDLKPANVVVLRRPPHPFIKILDFGLAKLRGAFTGHETKVGTVLGTPEYMAPEQCRGEEVDEKIDIYAMGVMLYEMITGRKPFWHPSPIRILFMQQRDPVPPPSQFVEISKDLERVILIALAKDPVRRFRSANAMLANLKRVIPSPLPWSVNLEPLDQAEVEPQPLPEPKLEDILPPSPKPAPAPKPAPKPADKPVGGAAPAGFMETKTLVTDTTPWHGQGRGDDPVPEMNLDDTLREAPAPDSKEDRPVAPPKSEIPALVSARSWEKILDELDDTGEPDLGATQPIPRESLRNRGAITEPLVSPEEFVTDKMPAFKKPASGPPPVPADASQPRPPSRDSEPLSEEEQIMEYAKTVPLDQEEIIHQMIRHSIPLDPATPASPATSKSPPATAEPAPSPQAQPRPQAKPQAQPRPQAKPQAQPEPKPTASLPPRTTSGTFQEATTLTGTMPHPVIYQERRRRSVLLQVLFWVGLAIAGAAIGAAIMLA